MTHYIIPGGRFDLSADRLLASGWTIRFAQRTADTDKKPPAGRTAFTCPACAAKAWAQDPERLLYCGCAGLPMPMVAG